MSESVRKKKGFLNNFIRVVGAVMALVILTFTLSYASLVEAKADTTVYSLTDEEITAASLKSAGVADEIMTADDFLADGERAADYEDIHAYLADLKENGIKAQDKAFIRDVKGEVIEEEPEEAAEEALQEEAVIEVSSEDTIEEVDSDSVDRDDWRLILVNKQNPVPTDYDAELSSINGSLLADSRIIDDIRLMLDAAKNDGVDLMICSAYRSYDRQTTLFENKINKLMGRGMSYMEAYAVGSMSVTVPGTSEHQLGLALDILTGSYSAMDDGFGETAAGKWLAENCDEYGFILRYPKGKEEITGIIYEPWHFRYVGKEYAKDIKEKGVALEEYVATQE